MDTKIKKVHEAQIGLLAELKALLEAQLGPVKLLDVLDYIWFCNLNSELAISLQLHERDTGMMYA